MKDKDVPISYYYVINGIRYHKFGFRKNKLKNKLSVYVEILTEYKILF